MPAIRRRATRLQKESGATPRVREREGRSEKERERERERASKNEAGRKSRSVNSGQFASMRS